MSVHDKIRARAHELYLADTTRATSRALDDWLAAEMEVLMGECRDASTAARKSRPSLTVHYINCFNVGDLAEPPLRTALEAWRSNSRNLVIEDAHDGNHLRARIDRLWQKDEVPDVLIIGGHGHESLTGFWVRNDPLRWHDLAFLLREQTAARCFIFYSCNGGYPGMTHVFGGSKGLDFAFGPRIQVAAHAMAKASIGVLHWREVGGGDIKSAKALVDGINSWGRDAHSATHEMFLRVGWGEGPGTRHPDTPNSQVPIGASISLRGWGELSDDTLRPA